MVDNLQFRMKGYVQIIFEDQRKRSVKVKIVDYKYAGIKNITIRKEILESNREECGVLLKNDQTRNKGIDLTFLHPLEVILIRFNRKNVVEGLSTIDWNELSSKQISRVYFDDRILLMNPKMLIDMQSKIDKVLTLEESLNLKKINHDFIHNTDKFYRMFGGLSSELLCYYMGNIFLEVKTDERWKKSDSDTALQLAESWKKFVPEFEFAKGYTVLLKKTTKQTGFAIKIKEAAKNSDEFANYVNQMINVKEKVTNEVIIEGDFESPWKYNILNRICKKK